MATFVNGSAATFRRDEGGSVMITFALMTVALFFLSGFAIDYGRIQDLRSRLADAADSASLAAGRAMLDGKLTDSEIISLATAYFTNNSKDASKLTTVANPKITIDRETGKVDIAVQSKIDMTLARIGGFDAIDVPVSSSAVYKSRDIEVGMAIDVTGSMDERIRGKRKMDSLKSAFREFTDELFPENSTSSQRIRMALAPYASAIKLGPYAAAASGGRSRDGCVTERRDGAASDAAGAFFVRADGETNVDPNGTRRPYDCSANKPAITPLLDSKAELDRIVDRYTAEGATGGHFGAQWAWNLISEDWAGTFGGDSQPDSYDLVEKGKLMKAVVLMTDGKFNTAYHGQSSSQNAVALCSAMKAKGVVVFAVIFGNDKGAAQTLRQCATPGDGYYAEADSEDELSAAFRNFAGKLGQLRISQ